MNGSEGGEQVLARIGFAERWLDRARRQCTEGHVTRGVLTLVLADAEVHHALEAAGVPAARKRVPRRHPGVLALAGVAAAVVLLVSQWPADSPVVSTPAPPAVQLTSASGTLLEILEPASRVPAGRVMIGSTPGVTPADASGGPAGRGIASAAGPSEAGTTLRSAAADQPVASVGSSHLSMPELIDLVLVAERALRTEPAGP